MATLNTLNPTLADVAKRMDPEGKIDMIVELLAEQNEVIMDATWIEGNLPTGHKTTVRTGLPTVTWRKLNYGVKASKSRTAQVTDAAGMLEAYAEVDKALADLNGNTNEFRLSEDRAFIESMNQNYVSTLFYGDTDQDPEKFMGLAPRYNDLGAESGANIIDAGGTGSDLTSVWLVVWSPNTIFNFYPKGSKAGLQHEDLGRETLFDADGGKYEGYRSHYKWDCGLTVRDWRYAVRIANINPATLTKDAATGSDLVDLMTDALERVENLTNGRAVFYCNRTVRSFLRRQIKNSNNVQVGMSEVAGKKVMDFDGVPVRRTDAILSTESQVVDSTV